MPIVTFKTKNGEKKEHAQVGERLIDVACRLNLDEEGIGKCGGHCLCGTCHVWVKKGAEHFEEADMLEENMLDTVESLKPESRLACQIKVMAAHKHIVLEVPKE